MAFTLPARYDSELLIGGLRRPSRTGARIEVSVRPRSLRVIVPVNCAAVSPSNDKAAAGFALQLP